MQGKLTAAIEEVARQRQLAKQILEGLLFSSPVALTLEQCALPLKELGEASPEWVVRLLKELSEELALRHSALEVAEVAGGYLMRTRAALSPYLSRALSRRHQDRLGPSQLEVLAIVAYRQPVTRSQIDTIRGVDSNHAVSALLERGLIEISGRAERPGRPALLATTRAFLQQFGLRDLSELLPSTHVEMASAAPEPAASGDAEQKETTE